jgi:hypothetical protein
MVRKVVFILGSVFLIGLFVWTEEKFAPTFHQCIDDWIANQGEIEPNQKSLIAAKFIGGRSLCVIRAIDHHNGFFAALAAFVIAWFTFALDRSTTSLWKIEERNFRDARRAFVFLDGFSTELTTAADARVVDAENLPKEYKSDPGLYITRFAVAPKWRNGGETQTKNMTIRVNWCGPIGDLVLDYSYRNPPVKLFIGPKAVEQSRFIDMPGVQALIDWSWHPIGDPPLILIWGRADYEDIFGGHHWIEWCRQLRLDRHDGRNLRANFIQWGDYNRSDEDKRE